jgi:tRNA nucleotidyltransferase/poly(A) polymerase
MRAVRFAAQLEFELDPDTEAGIAPALPSLAKVARERVSVELRKLLSTRMPSRGLAPAKRTGILASVLPALDAAIGDVPAWLALVDRADREVRLAALLVPLHSTEAPATNLDLQTGKQISAILRDLKFSNEEAALSAQLVASAHAPLHGTRDHDLLDDDVAMRRLLARLDRDKRTLAVQLWEAIAPGEAIVRRAAHVLAARPPLGIGELALDGKQLMAALAIQPGPIVGRLLAQLLDLVLEDPARNTRETLLAEAQRLELAIAHDDD